MKIRSTAYPTLELLQTLYPRVFTSDDKEILPLKINIHNDLFVALKDQASKRSIRDALKIYTKRPAYWKKLVLGAERVDLDGTVCGTVESDHLELGKQAITRASERLKEKKLAAGETVASKPKPAKPKAAPSKTGGTAERPAKANFLRKGQQNKPRLHPASNANAAPKFGDMNKPVPKIMSKAQYRSELASDLPPVERTATDSTRPVITLKKRRHFEKPEE